ncbi:MAG: uroporphyrinogen-III synthase [Candidatus Acidiferrales bacterium]
MSGELAGKRIVVTRSPEQAREVVEGFRVLGAVVFVLPAVSFSAPVDCEPLDAAIRELASYDWVLLTSVNAAKFFAGRCRTVVAAVPLAAPPRFAAVGPATASAATAEGFRVEYVAREYRGVALGRELGPAVSGRKVLLPRSDRANQDLPQALLAQGANVVQVVVYRTGGMGAHEAHVAEKFRAAEIDVVSIFSPSALANLQAEFGHGTLRRVAARAALAAVGPATAGAIREAGLPVAIVAKEATAASLVRAVADYFAAGSGAQEASV